VDQVRTTLAIATWKRSRASVRTASGSMPGITLTAVTEVDRAAAELAGGDQPGARAPLGRLKAVVQRGEPLTHVEPVVFLQTHRSLADSD